MDYYKEFSDGANDRTKSFVKQRDELSKTIQQAQKNLGGELEAVRKLKDRIAKLKSLSSISLTDDQNSFDKFKTSLKKLNTELETSEEICQTLQTEILPAKQGELKTAETNVKNILRDFILECRPIADKRIQVLLDECAAEREQFLASFRKIYQDCGETFIVNDETLLPGHWLAREALKAEPLTLEQPDKTPEPVQDNKTSKPVENNPFPLRPEQVPAESEK